MSNDSNTEAQADTSSAPQWHKSDTAITRDRSLPAHVKHVYAVLNSYADASTRIAHPGQDTIAADIGISERAVRTAVRIGAEAGLWDIIRTQAFNRYRLRDHGRGYIPGSGPLARPPAEAPTGTTCRSDDPNRHILPVGEAPCAAEQDSLTRERNVGAATRNRERAPKPLRSIPPPAAKPRVLLFTPRNFGQLSADDARAWLRKAAVPACARVDRELGANAVRVIGRHLLEFDDGCKTNRELLDYTLDMLTRAVDGDPDWQHLFIDHDRDSQPEPAEPTWHELHRDLDGYPNGKDIVDRRWDEGVPGDEIYAEVLMQAGVSA